MLANSGYQIRKSGLWVPDEFSDVPISPSVLAYQKAQAFLANDSATSGDGSIMATHTVSSKEHQVMMIADSVGQLLGSRDDWFAYFTPVTNALSREVGELFNADATVIVRVRGIWILPTSTAVTGAQIGFDINRISAIGTSGTSITPRPSDKSQAALSANITAHFGSSAGATLDHLDFQQFQFNEETNASTQLVGLLNLLPVLGDHCVEIVLRQNQGIQIKQTISNAVGLTGALLYFTVE